MNLKPLISACLCCFFITRGDAASPIPYNYIVRDRPRALEEQRPNPTPQPEVQRSESELSRIINRYQAEEEKREKIFERGVNCLISLLTSISTNLLSESNSVPMLNPVTGQTTPVYLLIQPMSTLTKFQGFTNSIWISESFETGNVHWVSKNLWDAIRTNATKKVTLSKPFEYNTFIGKEAGYDFLFGSYNFIFGLKAGQHISIGDSNLIATKFE